MRAAAACAVLACLLLVAPAAAADIEAALGDIVYLSGSSYESNTVYLFLTGPNLPRNGVGLDDISQLAEQGGFTRVSVGDDDRWTYDWNTRVNGGSLDEGTYTVWISADPADRSTLRSGMYHMLSVRLGSPSISAAGSTGQGSTGQAASVTGTAEIRSTPAGAAVSIDGMNRGTTPVTVGGLSPGSHAATITKTGYQTLSVQVAIETGTITEVNANLVPVTATETNTAATAPAGTGPQASATRAGIPLPPACMAAMIVVICLVAAFFRNRKQEPDR
jgi:hypothetical protein